MNRLLLGVVALLATTQLISRLGRLVLGSGKYLERYEIDILWLLIVVVVSSVILVAGVLVDVSDKILLGLGIVTFGVGVVYIISALIEFLIQDQE